MKQIVLAFFSLLILSQNTTAQVAKKILIEEFTNASCGPCAAQNPAFKALLDANISTVVPVKYQAWFPGFDPMNKQNPTEVAARGAYYGLNGVPTAWINGELPDTTYANGAGTWSGTYAGGPYGYNQAVIDYAAALTTPLSIALTHSLSNTLDTTTITCVIKNETTTVFQDTAMVLHVVIEETAINFDAAPGNNGETDFFNVMRKMIPNANGTKVAGAIQPGASLTFTFKVFTPEYIYRYDQIAIAAFAQSKNTQKVWQAGLSTEQALPIGGAFGDVSMESVTIPNASNCDYALTPQVGITNLGTNTVTSFEVGYSINGAVTVKKTWTGTLAPNAAQAVAFPQINIPTGAGTIVYQLFKVNGLRDVNASNSLPIDENTLAYSNVNVGIKAIESFETTTVETGVPSKAIIIKGDPTFMRVLDKAWFVAQGATTVTDQIGGFGTSNKSIQALFYSMAVTEDPVELVFDKIDLTNSVGTKIKFQHAYAQYGTENDKLEVQYSLDCGATWTTVWNKAGAALKTTAAQTAYFFPKAAQWKQDSVIVTALDGKTGVNIRFKCTSAFGNNLYIDNINIQSPTGTVDAGQLEGKVSMYPNPTSDVVNIDLVLAESTPVSVQIFDVAGKLVQTIRDNVNFASGAHSLTWEAPAAGLYIVKIRTNIGEVAQKLTVIK